MAAVSLCSVTCKVSKKNTCFCVRGPSSGQSTAGRRPTCPDVPDVIVSVIMSSVAHRLFKHG